MRDNLKFIDPLRICAFGWGYGGYAASMMLIDDSQQVLQCAVAINPIVSFGYHCEYHKRQSARVGSARLKVSLTILTLNVLAHISCTLMGSIEEALYIYSIYREAIGIDFNKTFTFAKEPTFEQKLKLKF